MCRLPGALRSAPKQYHRPAQTQGQNKPELTPHNRLRPWQTCPQDHPRQLRLIPANFCHSKSRPVEQSTTRGKPRQQGPGSQQTVDPDSWHSGESNQSEHKPFIHRVIRVSTGAISSFRGYDKWVTTIPVTKVVTLSLYCLRRVALAPWGTSLGFTGRAQGRAQGFEGVGFW